MTYFVSRHAGARAWAQALGLTVDRVLPALDPSVLAAGDCVYGTLPVHLAAQVCARGARYFHLSLDLPLASRGRELAAADMETHGARLEEYRVCAVGAGQ